MTKKLREFLETGKAYNDVSLEISSALADPLRKNKEDIKKMNEFNVGSFWI